MYVNPVLARHCPRGSILPLSSRDPAYSTGQFLLYVIPAKAGIQSNKAF
ncbi:MAG: hypothetical protein ACEY3D_09865 [Rickettsia sp.]